MDKKGQPEDYLPTSPGGVVCRAGGEAPGQPQAAVNIIDSRICVENELRIQALSLPDRQKTFQASPCKNYFLVELYRKPDIKKVVGRGTAFLIDRDRTEPDGTTYATFLTAGHVLFDYDRVVLKHSSELLKGGQALEKVKPLIDLQKTHNTRVGWYECPLFQDPHKDSVGPNDYGAIFVKKDKLRSEMAMLGIMTLDGLSVTPPQQQVSDISIAGYPLEWGNSCKGKPSKDLVVGKGKYVPACRLPADFIKDQSGHSVPCPNIDAHTADTSEGMSGSPVLAVGAQGQVIAIHVGGALVDGKTAVRGTILSWGNMHNAPAEFNNAQGVNFAVPISDELLRTLSLNP